MWLDSQIRRSPAAVEKNRKHSRTVFLYDEAKAEDWEDYREILEKRIKAKEEILAELKEKENNRTFAQNLQLANQAWSIFKLYILEAANRSLPKKRVFNNISHIKNNSTKSKLAEVAKKVSSWIRQVKKYTNLGLPAKKEEELNLDIKKINKKLNFTMPEIEPNSYIEWIDDMKGWWRIINQKRSEELERIKRKEIEANIDRRCEMLENKQGKMLSSLLNKPFSKITVDRLFKEQGNTRTLITDPKEVLKETKQHYENQIRARNPKDLTKSSKWGEIYEPISWIQESWYKDLSNEITEEEWLTTIRTLKNRTALDISGITYNLIKNASPVVQEHFRSFANFCIRLAIIPDEWKKAQIYPIPKSTNWNFDLGNTRPIALLETFRKCITKILSNRLSKVLVKYQILRGWNFAGLPGGSTEHPAHIVNMIAEDAKEKEAELWIVLQDMKKAFDSVSLKMLKKTLERIKIPAKLIDLVLLLFENRRSQIITAVGLTDPIELKDGIE